VGRAGLGEKCGCGCLHGEEHFFPALLETRVSKNDCQKEFLVTFFRLKKVTNVAMTTSFENLNRD